MPEGPESRRKPIAVLGHTARVLFMTRVLTIPTGTGRKCTPRRKRGARTRSRSRASLSGRNRPPALGTTTVSRAGYGGPTAAGCWSLDDVCGNNGVRLATGLRRRQQRHHVITRGKTRRRSSARARAFHIETGGPPAER